MRVLLFGASGDIGRHVRDMAHAAGHELILFTRDSGKLEPLRDREHVIVGDIADGARVADAVSGVNAVVSGLGPTTNTADQVPLFEAFANTLVNSMTATGVKRLVTISGGAVATPGERKPLSGRIASGVVRLFVRHVVAAKQHEFNIIAASSLEWVAPRPPRVVDAPFTGVYRVGPSARGMTIGNADLAHFIVTQLTDTTYLRQAPYISY